MTNYYAIVREKGAGVTYRAPDEMNEVLEKYNKNTKKIKCVAIGRSLFENINRPIKFEILYFNFSNSNLSLLNQGSERF